MNYEYFINLDERGLFYADLRDEHGRTFYEVWDGQLIDDGFMRHVHDVDGLANHLQDVGIIPPGSTITLAN